MGIIDLINSVGGVLVILTIIALILIGWYVYSQRRSLKTTNANQKSITPEMIEKPEIVVFLRPHPSNVQCLMLCIENIGTRTAYNVQFKTSPSPNASFITPSSNLSNVNTLTKNNFLRKGIECFGPGQKIEQFLISLMDGLPEELKKPHQISVNYTDSLNHPYDNTFALNFGNFECLLSIDSEIEKLTLELRSLINVIQARSSKDIDNIETLRPPQTPKNMISKTQTKKIPEDDQPVQDDQDKPLSPELQEIVDLYNAGNDAKLRRGHSPFHSIRVSNETERFKNPNIPPVFQTDSSGSFVAYAIDSEDLYAVTPFSGCILQNELYSSGSFGEVFECPGFDPEYKYQVRVIRPALFIQDNEKWTLEKKGKLELKEKDQ